MTFSRTPEESWRSSLIGLVMVSAILWSPTQSFLLERDNRIHPPNPITTSAQSRLHHSSFAGSIEDSFGSTNWSSRRRKFQRKWIPETEQEARALRKKRQKEYERLVTNTNNVPSIWSFESLFPEPIVDTESVDRDLYAVKRRDNEKQAERKTRGNSLLKSDIKRQAARKIGSSSLLKSLWTEPEIRTRKFMQSARISSLNETTASAMAPTLLVEQSRRVPTRQQDAKSVANATVARVDRGMTRKVEDTMYGFRRGITGEIQYETSLMGDGAVQFRDGVRLGNALPINSDRLNFMAKKEMQKGRIEEARELYERAVEIDPRDGRAYLGLSRCAQRRRDFKLAREWLKTGISNSVSALESVGPDKGANPFLLQALGCLEEKAGQLAEAEALYKAAVRSRPSHSAGWVALGQLRVRKLGQSVEASRSCFASAERELKAAGLPQSSHVYTAWADLEHKKAGDFRAAKKLLNSALEIDPKCSVAWLQLGMLESETKNWDESQNCFEKVLAFDQRNSRVLQAYALMESRRPEGDSRKAIGLFEKALAANPRDAGVLQAFGLYVERLGDLESAKGLLRRATETDKRHAPAWQALGVLENRLGNPEKARSIFQQGIWACAQLTGSNSGGHHCARLWQAWGVLEAQEGNHAAARRCFSRALDADSRNVPTLIAWSLMEEKLGNVIDARAIFERALPRFAAGCDSKKTIWRNYELMEQRVGDSMAAQKVYQRAMRDVMTQDDARSSKDDATELSGVQNVPNGKSSSASRNVAEGVESRGDGEVWLNDKAIEAKLPKDRTSRTRKL